MVLKFALKVGGIPSPVEVSGPPVVDNPSLPGNPLGPMGPTGPIAPSLPGGPVLPPDLYVLLVPYGHLQHVLPRKYRSGLLGDPLHCPLYFICCYPVSMVIPYGLKPDY